MASFSFDDHRCQAPTDYGEPCGELLSFDVLRDFKRLYEKKLQEIDREGGGDCLELKNMVQQRWIQDLTDQTEMMVKIIKELELEATERVKKLEEKLQTSAKCACEVMKRYQMYEFSINSDDSFQKVYYLENDVRNLLEFIRRVREDGCWCIDGLQFYDVVYTDLFGKSRNFKEKQCPRSTSPEKEIIPINGNNNDDELTRLSKELEYMKSFGNIEELSRDLKKRNAEFEVFKQSMLDMRTALTEEVACKHDMISSLRREIQQLEERCLQADKQTAFKDDIIKELRKEIKQLKQQTNNQDPSNSAGTIGNSNNDHVNKEEMQELKSKIVRLSSELRKLKEQQEQQNEVMESRLTVQDSEEFPSKMRVTECYKMEKEEVNNTKAKLMQNKDEIIKVQSDTLNKIQNQLQECRVRELEVLEEAKSREMHLIGEMHVKEHEINELKCKCEELEMALVHVQDRADNLEKAVDLYLNSVNVLEASEEKSKIEIEQLRMTIANLQEALIDAKHELDELREKSQQDVSWAARWFGASSAQKSNSSKSVHDV